MQGDYDIGKDRSAGILALLLAERVNARERVLPQLKSKANSKLKGPEIK